MRSTLANYDSQELLNYFLAKERPEPYRKISEDEIDYSDIPELTEEQMKHAKRTKPGRPLLGAAQRKLISIKVDPFLLQALKVHAKIKGEKYQSLIHRVLENYMRKHAT